MAVLFIPFLLSSLRVIPSITKTELRLVVRVFADEDNLLVFSARIELACAD
jgi:hypothetical protein